jgi:hypothetical protein
MPEEDRNKYGMVGHEWASSPEANMTAENMCTRFRDAINITMENWIAPNRFQLYDTQEQLKKFNNKKSGISI